MPLYSSPIFPKIILLDIRLAIVGGEGGGGCLIVLTKYKIMLLDYLDKCYKISKEEKEKYFNNIPLICSGHLIRAIERFTENAVPCCKNQTLRDFCIKIMERMIMTKESGVFDILERSTAVVLTTKYISKDYLSHLHIVEKAINNFDLEPHGRETNGRR